MIAESMIGRGDQAFDYYKRINPSAREAISEVHRCEPYVYAQTIAGKEAPTHGEAKKLLVDRHSQLELCCHHATYSWNQTYLPWLVGEPVIPENWSGFEARRIFRDVAYHIKVERNGPGNTALVYVNGQLLDGCVISIPPAGTTEVTVVVTLG
jgi:cellobiose phosphorylase